MKHRGLKPFAALLLILLVGLLSFFVSRMLFQQQVGDLEALEATNPQKVADAFFAQIKQRDFTGVFDQTIKEYPINGNEEAYVAKLNDVLDGVEAEQLTLKQLSEDTYGIYDGTTLLMRFIMQEENESYHMAIPMRGNETVTLEIPTHIQPYLNRQPVETSYRIQQNKEASNFLSTTLEDVIVHVDEYEIDNCIGMPELTDASGNPLTYVQDAITGHYLVGKEVKESGVEERFLECAKRLAMYPAQDIGLGSVQEVCIPSSIWYQRYVTLQNYWFTGHDVMKFSNEAVTKMTQQSDDTIVADVIFDYFADNGEVSRTWYIGYQMTFLKQDGQWMVLDMEINNELNPRQIQPE